VAKRQIWVGLALVAAAAVAIGYFFVVKNKPVTASSDLAMPIAKSKTPETQPTVSKAQQANPKAIAEGETVTPTQDKVGVPLVRAVPSTSQSQPSKPTAEPLLPSTVPSASPDRSPHQSGPSALSAAATSPSAPNVTLPPVPPKLGERAPEPVPPPLPASPPPKAGPVSSDTKRSTQVTIPLPSRKSNR
jgi:hypothetical protein